MGCVHCFFSDVGNYVSTAQLRGHLLRALGVFIILFFCVGVRRDPEYPRAQLLPGLLGAGGNMVLCRL